ncbi:hypothetical protein NDU88_003115 [Pleurodeles waltl]|uniref:Uncharacterized protein n=1 Tax=Pleurodeles waltl TaxID=8319 RepID=A0AAV7RBZ1_PLEWA|nr:hypothetical protein NDU88_003115 [Pleurodeles waltl]
MSTDAHSPGGTSSAALSDPEALPRLHRITKMPDIAGLLKARVIEEEKEEAAAADAATAEAEEDGWGNRDVGRREFHRNTA